MNKNPQNKTSEFIEKAIKKHGDKYDYCKVEYTGSHNKVSSGYCRTLFRKCAV